MRYSHFAHIADPGQFCRRLSPEQAARIVEMKDQHGLSWGSIAAWFTRNGTPVSYQTVQRYYERQRVA